MGVKLSSEPQRMSIKGQRKEFNIVEKYNHFSSAKVYIMYAGKNRNNSNISRESADNALNTLYNKPIIGEFLLREGDNESNFGTHGGKIILDDNGIRYEQTTKPVGVIPESANIYWETIKDSKERSIDYLVVEGALLWNRYEEEVTTLKEDNFGQSMEIEVEDANYDDETGLFDILQFSFSALCILGIEGRRNGHVEPAFEDAKIITYSLDSKDLTDMTNELKEFYSEMKEENKVSVEGLEKFTKDVEDEQKETKNEETDTTEQKDEEIVDATKETDKAPDEPVVEDPQKESADGYHGEDTDVEKTSGTAGDAGGTTDTGDTTTDTTTDARTVADTPSGAETTATDNTDYKAKYESVKSKNDSLQSELDELREYKRKSEEVEFEKEVFTMFNKLGLDKNDIKDLDIYAYTVEELEDKGYAILGRKASGKQEFSKDEETETKQTNKVDFNYEETKNNITRYGNLLDEYSAK